MVVGEFTQEIDLAVIGGGPGGYAAAFRAAELGQQVIIIDRTSALGGRCLHAGCVPSKTLLTVADAIHLGGHAAQYGVTYGVPSIDPAGVRAWVDRTVDGLAKGLAAQAKRLGVEHVQGLGVFEDGKHLGIRGGSIPRVKFRRAIIATGSASAPHPALPFADARIWSAEHAIRVPEVPGSMLVIGDGYMALEVATIYAALGTGVTLAMPGEGLLPDADADLLTLVTRRLRSRLAGMIPHAVIGAVTLDGPQPAAEIGGTSVAADRIVVATGRRPHTEDLDLAKTGVQTDDHGFIVVDDRMRTADPRILAVGDVTGGAMLANAALAQGRVAAEVIAGWSSVHDVRAVPMVAFTDPQIAWCGVTERSAAAEGHAVGVATVRWGASGRAAGMGRTDGLTKILYDPDTKLVLGVGIVGPHAAEMIGEGALAIEMGAELDDLAGTLHPHPTMSELIADAARS